MNAVKIRVHVIGAKAKGRRIYGRGNLVGAACPVKAKEDKND